MAKAVYEGTGIKRKWKEAKRPLVKAVIYPSNL